MAWKLIPAHHCNTPTKCETLDYQTALFAIDRLTALYALSEIFTLRTLPIEQVREIHRFKAIYPGQLLVQD